VACNGRTGVIVRDVVLIATVWVVIGVSEEDDGGGGATSDDATAGVGERAPASHSANLGATRGGGEKFPHGTEGPLTGRPGRLMSQAAPTAAMSAGAARRVASGPYGKNFLDIQLLSKAPI